MRRMGWVSGDCLNAVIFTMVKSIHRSQTPGCQPTVELRMMRESKTLHLADQVPVTDLTTYLGTKASLVDVSPAQPNFSPLFPNARIHLISTGC